MIRHLSRPPLSRRCVTWLSTSSLLLVLWLAVSQAQVRTTVTSDGTLGTTVTPNGNIYKITGGTRPGNGPNLFHSFDRFSIGPDDTARFTGPGGITNILSRVTGGQRSEIDGRLQSTIPGAHFYLLNPSGVVFGPNATLDVQGSFHVSTADYLRLADGARFFARLGENSTLSVAPPVAFGFLGPTPAPITVDGSALQVLPRATLSVVGGDIMIAGPVGQTAAGTPTLNAPGGRIHLASVASAGEVGVPPPGQSPDWEGGTVTRWGRLELSRGARVTASSTGDQDAGDVAVRAETLRLTGGAQIDGNTTGQGQGGRVTVVARDIDLAEGSRIQAQTAGAGRGGTITIQTGTLRLTGEAQTPEGLEEQIAGQTQISASTEGQGQGGRVTVVARDIDLTEGSRIQAHTSGAGRGGTITIQTGTLRLTGGALIDSSALGAGQGGSITVQAREAVQLTDRGAIVIDALSSGDGGQVSVSAPTVHLDHGKIQSDGSGEGAAGSMTVVATETISLRAGATLGSGTISSSRGDSGRVFVAAPLVSLEGGSVIGASTSGSGHGGEVTIEAGTLRLTGAGTAINSGSFGAGPGGNLRVRASEAVFIEEKGMLDSSAQSGGDAGQIVVHAPTVHLASEGRIQARTTGDGNAGNIEVQGARVTLTGGAQILTSSGNESQTTGKVMVGTGRAGNITINATEELSLEGRAPTGTDRSGVVSQTLGTGAAGQVTIATPRLTMAEGGRIGTDTGGDGRAGDVVVHAGSVALASGAQISSRSGIERRGRPGLLVGTGPGGIVILDATEGVTITGPSSGLVASTAGQGLGGDITVTAPTVTMTGGFIQAETQGAGRAGTITLNVGSLAAMGQATISVLATEASVADGGDIQVHAQGTLRLRDSQITTAVRSGEGQGGNILLDPEFVILERSQIVANAFGGPGGNIKIVAQGFVTDAASQVSASSAKNVNGIVNIQAVTTPIGLVAPSPPTFASAAALLRSPCAARLHEGTVSTLVERGRAGVPATPDGVLPSRLALTLPGTATPAQAAGRPSAAHVWPPEGSQRDLSEPLSIRGWSASADALRRLPGDCASR
jgi:filamentous hemagglutinin family protein